MTDNGAFEFRVDERERNEYYAGIISHMREAMRANNDFDGELEREACVLAHDLLSAVMGR